MWRVYAWYEALRYAWSVRRLGLEPPDLMIASAQPLAWALARKFRRTPVVYLPHSLVAPFEVGGYRWASPWQRWANVTLHSYLEKWLLRRSVTTVRFSRFACEALEQYYGSRIPRRWTLVPAAIALPPEPRPRPPGDVVRLLTVGRLAESKNVGFLIRSLARFAGLPWTLDVVGDGETRSELERLVGENGLQGRVVFHGHQGDVHRFYAAADLFVMPSRLEYLPIVLLEAMSHGLATLSVRSDGTTYRNSNHEVVTHDRDGFLAGSEPDFVALLGELIADRGRREEAGRAARQTVERNHRWDIHLECFERLIEKAAAHRRGGARRDLVGQA
jgi:glycosyltransferase involved in cell wall biosynthesis